MSGINLLLEDLIKKFKGNPRAILTLEYIEMLDFIFNVHKADEIELSDKLMSICVEKYGNQFVFDAIARAAIRTFENIQECKIKMN